MKSARVEIAEAIQNGIVSMGGVAPVFDRGERIEVRVRGIAEPIVVTDDDVVLPPALEHMRAGIQLDVAAIRASRGCVVCGFLGPGAYGPTRKSKDGQIRHQECEENEAGS